MNYKQADTVLDGIHDSIGESDLIQQHRLALAIAVTFARGALYQLKRMADALEEGTK